MIIPEDRGPWFLCDSRDYQLNSFCLEDYYQLEHPGFYTLTVWPIIYKQSATNLVVYHRVDLPPARVEFQWSSKGLASP